MNTSLTLAGFLITLSLIAQTPAPPRGAFTGTMPAGDGGPRNHRILLASSKDGLNWTVADESLAEQASVPELFEGPDGRLILIFVDASGQAQRGALGAMIRGHDGKWSRTETNLRGADPNVVRLKDGSYRGYTKERSGAIIVFSSRDGLQWEQRGVSFQDERYRNSTDSDVFETPDGWVALISLGPRMLRCTSSDGLKFTTDGTILDLGGSVSDTVKVAGGWRTFFHVNANPRTEGKMLIRSAFTADGKSWKVEPGDRVVAPASGPASLGVADPAPVQLKDDSWLMAIKSFIEAPQFGRGTGFSQRTGGQGSGRSDLPLPAGEGRGEGERRGQGFQVPNDFTPKPPPQDFNTANGPWNNDVLVYRAGAGGSLEKLATFERAGVPTVARLTDGRLIAAHQHFPENDRESFDKVAVHFSSDEGRTWTAPAVITVKGLPEGMRFPFDPTLVTLPDGRVRLYFTGNYLRQAGSTPAIHSAISTDGVSYTYEPGVRFAVEERAVIDCAVVLHNGVFHLYAPDNGTGDNPGRRRENESAADRPREGVGYHATSKDGLNFTRVADVTTTGNNRWLGNVQSDGGQLLFFGTGPGPWPLTSSDGATWTAGTSKWRLPGADPGAVKLKDGSWLVVLTGPPVRGARSAEQRSAEDDGAPQGRAMLGAPPRGLPPLPAGEGRGEGERLGQPFQARGEPFGSRGKIRVEKVDSKYKTAPGAKAGSFVTGQGADLMLGGFGFNQSGGALQFNHPTGLATDGKALLMTDRWNNRVLIWKSAPAKNTPPDLVLGQPDFTQNHSGMGKHQLNWPGNVAITPDGKRIAVTDTSNDRILIWNSFPTKNGQPADLVLDLPQLSGGGGVPDYGARRQAERDAAFPPPPSADRAKAPSPLRSAGALQRFSWPWGVWTDGTKLAVVATHGSAVLIWNSHPTRDNQPPDLVLRPDGAGTPRNVTSDGKTFFAVSDHNYGDNSRPATMVWNSFPTSSSQPPDWTWREWVKGALTPGGGLVVAGIQSIYLFNKPPRDAETDADVVLRPQTYRNGDGPDAVVANGRLYVCTYNGNHILGWNTLPTRDNQPADFALGSERTDQDTWAENFFIQNAVVATDGKRLFVTSDFDRKMFVWRNLPDESAAKPDLVMHLPEGPWDNELHGTTLALAGRSSVSIWKKLPLNGESPDIVLRGRIGSAELGELTGVAFDDKYFYLSDRRNECIYVWEGIPNPDSEPKFTLKMRSPGRLTSDGSYLCAAPFEGNGIQLWRVSDFAARDGAQLSNLREREGRTSTRGLDSRAPEPLTLGGRGQFNLPSECLIAAGRLFVANRSFNRVDVWNRVEDALDGRPADALLGASDAQDRKPGIERNKLFMPGSLAWGGGYLWVGEFKFSTRILRFSPQVTAARAGHAPRNAGP
jgi:DNA-binding beta-propeller fold protein YncE